MCQKEFKCTSHSSHWDETSVLYLPVFPMEPYGSYFMLFKLSSVCFVSLKLPTILLHCYFDYKMIDDKKVYNVQATVGTVNWASYLSLILKKVLS